MDFIKDNEKTLTKVGLSLSAIAVTTIGSLWYLGAFQKPRAKDGWFPGCHTFFYKELQCDVKELG